MYSARHHIRHFDWGTLALTLAIIALSLLMLYTMPSSDQMAPGSGIYLKQLAWIRLGLGMMVVVVWSDYHVLSRYALVFYGMVLVSLAAVLAFGPVINGAQRWLPLGP